MNLQDALKAFEDFRKKQQMFMKQCFLKKYLYSESVFNILYIEIKHIS